MLYDSKSRLEAREDRSTLNNNSADSEIHHGGIPGNAVLCREQPILLEQSAFKHLCKVANESMTHSVRKVLYY